MFSLLLYFAILQGVAGRVFWHSLQVSLSLDNEIQLKTTLLD